MNTGDVRAVNVVRLIDGVLGELESLCRQRCVSVEFIGRGCEQHIKACHEGLTRLLRGLLVHVIHTATPNASVEILLRRVHASLLVCIRDRLDASASNLHGAAFPSLDGANQTGFCCEDTEGKLTECRDIVAEHDGEMWAWKTLAGGTVICFELPIRGAAATEGNETAPAAA